MASDEIIAVKGGQVLNGTIDISGSKNACLPLMLLSMLTDEECILTNVPLLADVGMLRRLLVSLGGEITIKRDDSKDSIKQQSDLGCVMRLRFRYITCDVASYDLVSKMRASFWVVSALVARLGRAKVSMPGGCNLGQRPIDFILESIEALGAKVEKNHGYINVSSEQGLKGAKIIFNKVSVGATHCALIASVLAQGITEIHNAACEPEVTAVAQCLVKMGAQISGIGTKTLVVKGVKKLQGFRFSVPPDRIETASYAVLVAATGGNVRLNNVEPEYLEAPLDKLKEAGVHISVGKKSITVRRDIENPLRPVNITTDVYPGFPTDLQAQFMALMGLADGQTYVCETIYENRFMHVPELLRFGAVMEVINQSNCRIEGVKGYIGAEVRATDLRASMSLIIAALAAQGYSQIHDVYHLDRGFECIEQKLTKCGAIISRKGGLTSFKEEMDFTNLYIQ